MEKNELSPNKSFIQVLWDNGVFSFIGTYQVFDHIVRSLGSCKQQLFNGLHGLLLDLV